MSQATQVPITELQTSALQTVPNSFWRDLLTYLCELQRYIGDKQGPAVWQIGVIDLALMGADVEVMQGRALHSDHLVPINITEGCHRKKERKRRVLADTGINIAARREQSIGFSASLPSPNVANDFRIQVDTEPTMRDMIQTSTTCIYLLEAAGKSFHWCLGDFECFTSAV